ncbi:MAG: flagellar motor protein MotB [Aquificae bacterium]|nr:flagellar motor protein MotB [Aquificota bacterium]
MARKKKQECKSIPGWLISFGDLMSLLLTFFILLFSMGTISLEKFHMVIKGITESLGGRKVIHESKILNAPKGVVQFPDMYPKLEKKKRLKKELREIQNILKSAGIDTQIQSHGSNIRLRLNTDKMFPVGKAYPYSTVIPLLTQICDRLKILYLPLTIEGHTDNLPILSGKTNLELSVERAVNILKIFIKCGYPEKILSARGYGEYRPIAPNDTPQGRAKNRRIEFVIDVGG